MNQQSIDTIEGYLGVPLIDPAAIHELDSKEIAAALGRLEGEAAEAREEVEDAHWNDDKDMLLLERLREITALIQEVIGLCATCQVDQVCASHETLKLWVDEA